MFELRGCCFLSQTCLCDAVWSDGLSQAQVPGHLLYFNRAICWSVQFFHIIILFVCLFVLWQLFKIPLSHIMNGFAPLNLPQFCHLPLLFPPLPFTFYHLNAFILQHCFNYHLCLKNKEKVNQAAAFDLILLVFVSPG